MPAGPGRPPKEKSFANMLNIAIKEATEEGHSKLRAVADALVEKAMNGDIQAIKELADRIDGKVPQAIEGSEDDGSHKIIHEIRRVIEDARG